MNRPFLGTQALTTGALTRGQLRWNYRAILPNVYVRADTPVSLDDRIAAAWLWSGKRAVIAGRSAAALHGALWVKQHVPIELLWRCGRPPAGIIARNERVEADELVTIRGMQVTTPERTAFDLARHLARLPAVSHLDALARATGLQAASALRLGERYPGARGVVGARRVIPLLDPGGQSPKETWLRLTVLDAGFPRPTTQIPVTDGFNTAYLDMGWEDPQIGLDYDGDQHRKDRVRYVHDVGRNELVAQTGWMDLHVLAEHSPAFIIHRLRRAFERRGWARDGRRRPDCR
ncbi:hypothetical protein MCHIJ_23930 [Mycolicibacterium chitae]|uniref:Cullin, a subunit of E3 ubiquitin ligase n=1 Tax=Mycolicibacterium chitae TaxID=1792 RepID=A0A3S4RAV6_MYCCI|nr:hypothetical protein [Mycolicibacterium chitae]MCV7107638.1 hypothetical protein [Mycolicibacterium chitae]BBZ02956.1 hypothetical protein MCHIJ_23930 [Mycolicibacterium chitae]VEG46020.1 cullin, a subunit of E3 ubiquitin ligase [Mycolicibacterium chitae]